MTTITLKYPVEHGGATYSELTLKRLNAGQLAKMEEESRTRGFTSDDTIRPAIFLISLAANIHEDVVGLMDAEDFDAANEAVADFLSSRGRSKGKPRK